MSIGERIAELLKDHFWWFVGNLGVPGMPDQKGFKCSCGWEQHGEDADPHGHVASALVAELRAQMPAVSFKGPHDTDGGTFRRMAQNLDNGYAPGGGNVMAAASRLFRWAADLLDTAPKAELEVRAKAGWERVS